GGDVTHVVITYDGNGGTLKDSDITTATQKIVTQTNSRLEIPTFERFGYILVGWNTRADGKGTDIDIAESMNTDKDMTLYAQWVLQQ
ncbi:MAG: InlB B-repeat-containing protein, partial [Bacteroidaceae bacterium]|nr:InlB B-repeat-containing protein [Bacteroidaceae bacterium]